jgi:TatD DNase family protein
MLVDSHCHLALPDYDADRAAVLARARAAGVRAMIDVGIGPGSWERTLALAGREPDVWAALGLHPNDVAECGLDALDRLPPLLARPRVVAVGETGLDYHWQRTPPLLQRQAFVAQLALARSRDLPVVIHCRDAYDDLLAIIAAEGGGTRGVLHCFGGTAAQATRAFDLGYAISLGGPVTFKNAAGARAVAALAPADRLLLETDAPYLTPHPYRGRRNEPAHVALVAAAVAAARGTTVAAVIEQTGRAAAALFRLPLADAVAAAAPAAGPQ